MLEGHRVPVDFKLLKKKTTNLRSYRATNFQNEEPIHFKLVTTNDFKIKAEFVGYKYQDALHSQLIGVFRDLTDPNDPIE